MALVVKQDVLFDPIEIRFLSPVGVILQSQPIADLVKEPFLGGNMDHLLINKSSIILYNGDWGYISLNIPQSGVLSIS